MLANPEAQRKAQAEIDCVTGGKFLPGFNDNGRLPYVTAISQEILRWKNVTLFGNSALSHSAAYTHRSQLFPASL
jgi:cytochrome P450